MPDEITQANRPAAPADGMLLAAKLRPPHLRPNHVARPRLLRRLDEALDKPITLIAAPAGFGKTTLLASWLRQHDERGTMNDEAIETSIHRSPFIVHRFSVAWLSLDADDNDPETFVRYLVAALQNVAPGIGATSLALLQPVAPRPKTLLAPLLNELAAADPEAVLVLDDLHAIANPPVLQALEVFLEHLPARLHLVIACRSEPALPLARLRARGQLVEIRAEQLRFAGAEAQALLHAAYGSAITSGEAAALAARTEGWAAGLQLAGLALRDQPNRAAFIAGFAGSHRFVADYLAGEVLARLPAELRAFVLQTVILDRMCGALCDALVGLEASDLGVENGDARPDSSLQPLVSLSYSQRILEQLERANLFVVPLDDERAWFRYQQLFAEAARELLLRERGPASVAELHRRASAWYDAAELADEAIHHALMAGAPDLAAEIVERRAAGLIETGVLVPLRRWLARLPDSTIRARAPLALAAAIVSIAVGALDMAEPLISAAEAGPPGDYPHAGWLDRSAAVALLARASLARAQGRPRPALELLEPALDGELRPIPFLRTWGLWELSESAKQAGDPERAQAALTTLLAEAASYPGLLIQAALSQGRNMLLGGRLRAAARLYEHMLAQARDLQAPHSRAIGLLQIGLGAIDRERGRLEQADAWLEQALALGRDPPNALLLALGNTVHALVWQARGDLAAARATLARAHEVLPALSAPVFLEMLFAHGYARAALAAGDAPDLPALADEARLAGLARVAFDARLLLHQGQPASALAMTTPALDTAEAQAGGAIELLVLRALAQAGCGDTPAALATIERALRLAEPEGYLRLFADEGAPMRDLLREAYPRGTAREYIERLLSAFPPARNDEGRTIAEAKLTHRSSFIVQPQIEPLTSRELEVLELIAAGHSNRSIARALTIELGTVKRHTHNLLGKLGAQSRTQALARARALGLLADD